MKNLLCFIGWMILLSACGSSEFACDETEFNIIGRWGLIESCFDIGDGTQDCTDHNRDLTYEFFDNGTVMVFNNEGCLSNYLLDDDDLTLSSIDRDMSCIDQPFFFSVVDACTVMISPWCIEGCPMTYVKI